MILILICFSFSEQRPLLLLKHWLSMRQPYPLPSKPGLNFVNFGYNIVLKRLSLVAHLISICIQAWFYYVVFSWPCYLLIRCIYAIFHTFICFLYMFLPVGHAILPDKFALFIRIECLSSNPYLVGQHIAFWLHVVLVLLAQIYLLLSLSYIKILWP